jgi:hypothetical protein
MSHVIPCDYVLIYVPSCVDSLQGGILDPKKLLVTDCIDFVSTSDTDGLPVPVSSPGAGQTKSGRASFKNELTERIGSKYRDADKSETLMGEQTPLGKAFGIVTVCLFGPNLPTEKHQHRDRLQVWKNAAKYALDKDSIKVVLEWPDQKSLVIYMQGLLNTALVCVRTEQPTRVPAFMASTPYSLGSEAI